MIKCTYCKEPLPDCPHCIKAAKQYPGQKWYCSRECVNKMRAKEKKPEITDDQFVVPFEIPL